MAPDPTPTRDPHAAASSMIDWRLAESTAQRLLPNGPAASPDQAHDVVEGLRRAAVEAEQPIADVTRMQVDVPKAPVIVIDRAAWVTANVEGLQAALAPLTDVLLDRRRRKATAAPDGEGAHDVISLDATRDADPFPDDRDTTSAAAHVGTRALKRAGDASNAVVGAIGSRATGFQVGSLLAFVGTKVLGQHELFVPDARSPRLLLIAPNVLSAERSMGVDPTAFRRWICLHEETHRVQLAAVPWLPGQIEADLRKFFEAADTESGLSDRLGSVVASATGAVRGDSARSLLDAVQTPEQRAILDRLVALMTLLEGHADWAMDAVGEDVVPGLAEVRTRFEQRRGGGGALDQALRRLFGLDAKLAQYRDGAAFVREVVALVGVEGLNAAWTSADTLPMREEIAAPRRWVDRVHTGTSS
jgi:putative hydrolase